MLFAEFVSAIGFSGAVVARVLTGDRSLQRHAVHAAATGRYSSRRAGGPVELEPVKCHARRIGRRCVADVVMDVCPDATLVSAAWAMMPNNAVTSSRFFR